MAVHVDTWTAVRTFRIMTLIHLAASLAQQHVGTENSYMDWLYTLASYTCARCREEELASPPQLVSLHFRRTIVFGDDIFVARLFAAP